MIQKVTIQDIDVLLKLVQNVIHHMRNQGIDQWDEFYPDKEILEKDIYNQQAFGYYEDNALCAYLTLNEEFDEEYLKVNWKTTGKPLIIHRLFIQAEKQGKGIAKKLIDFAEAYAKEHQYQSLRLDAFSKNPGALHLYESRGYIKAGEVQFRKGTFYCYEKNIQ